VSLTIGAGDNRPDCHCKDANVEAAMDAQEVLHRMIALYGSLISYSDTGNVKTKIMSSGVVHRKWFSTLYQKPSSFRFTFFSPHPYPQLAHIVTQHVVGSDGAEGYRIIKRAEDAQPLRSTTSVNLAIAGATGISSGSAHTIGRLLLPQVAGLSILDLLDPRFNDETDIDGKVCHSIVARFPKGGEQEVWIEKDSLLLRKVIVLRETVRSEEVRENIRVNEVLEGKLFAA
jgi:hypothetical protein